MARKEHHIVPNSNGGWDVKRENAKRSSGHYETKKEAMEAGRRMSINQGTELIPHRKDGHLLLHRISCTVIPLYYNIAFSDCKGLQKLICKLFMNLKIILFAFILSFFPTEML